MQSSFFPQVGFRPTIHEPTGLQQVEHSVLPSPIEVHQYGP